MVEIEGTALLTMSFRALASDGGVGGDARVERRRFQLRMSEQDLNHPDIGILLQKMGRKAMPERVW